MSLPENVELMPGVLVAQNPEKLWVDGEPDPNVIISERIARNPNALPQPYRVLFCVRVGADSREEAAEIALKYRDATQGMAIAFARCHQQDKLESGADRLLDAIRNLESEEAVDELFAQLTP